MTMEKTKMYLFLLENKINLTKYLRDIDEISSKINALDIKSFVDIDLEEQTLDELTEDDYQYDIMVENGVDEGISVSFSDSFWKGDVEHTITGFLYKKEDGYHGLLTYENGEIEYMGGSTNIEELEEEIYGDLEEFTPLSMEEEMSTLMSEMTGVISELVEKDSWKPLSDVKVFSASTGSYYIEFGIGNTYDENGDLEYSDEKIKLSIRDHEPSPFREKEFGRVNSYFNVDWNKASSIENSIIWLHQKLSDYRDDEIELQKNAQ